MSTNTTVSTSKHPSIETVSRRYRSAARNDPKTKLDLLKKPISRKQIIKLNRFQLHSPPKSKFKRSRNHPTTVMEKAEVCSNSSWSHSLRFTPPPQLQTKSALTSLILWRTQTCDQRKFLRNRVNLLMAAEASKTVLQCNPRRALQVQASRRQEWTRSTSASSQRLWMK